MAIVDMGEKIRPDNLETAVLVQLSIALGRALETEVKLLASVSYNPDVSNMARAELKRRRALEE